MGSACAAAFDRCRRTARERRLRQRDDAERPTGVCGRVQRAGHARARRASARQRARRRRVDLVAVDGARNRQRDHRHLRSALRHVARRLHRHGADRADNTREQRRRLQQRRLQLRAQPRQLPGHRRRDLQDRGRGLSEPDRLRPSENHGAAPTGERRLRQCGRGERHVPVGIERRRERRARRAAARRPTGRRFCVVALDSAHLWRGVRLSLLQQGRCARRVHGSARLHPDRRGDRRISVRLEPPELRNVRRGAGADLPCRCRRPRR